MALLTTHELAFSGIRYPDLTFQEGGMHFVCGPSGCGKTSLLRLCNRTLEPSSGCVRLKGRNVRDMDPLQLRRNVLLVGQEVFLFPGSVAENFGRFHSLREMPAPAPEDMRRFLRLCAFDHRLDHACEQLSGGERQRVFLAICLSLEPAVLLLDEPTSALDAATARCLMEQLCTYGQDNGTSFLIVSHDRELAARYARSLTELGGRL